MPAPPKPWEKAGATGQSSVAISAPAAATPSTGAATTSSPALPPKPANMTASATTVTPLNSVAPADRCGTRGYKQYGNRYGATTGYGATSAYGGYGSSYGSSYGASPYSRYGGGYGGGYGSSMGYGGGYGSYGSPYGGVGGFGAPGMNPDMSLTRTMESGTAATFQLLQSIVSAFGGFAQMLESTFMATHSSFFAMIGVAEQLASLRNWLGEALSVFTMIRFVKRLLGRGDDATGQIGAGAAGGSALSANNFKAFEQTGTTTPASGAAPNQPRPSKKPLVIFFLTVIGLPWLMTKLVRLMTAKQEAEARRLGLPPGAVIPLFDPSGQPLPQHLQPPGVDLNLLPQNQQAMLESAVDPSKLTFVRALHPHVSNDEFELSFEKNDIVAVLTPKEERADPGWWRGRLRDGRVGWFPSTHVQEIPMNAKKVDDEKQK